MAWSRQTRQRCFLAFFIAFVLSVALRTRYLAVDLSCFISPRTVLTSSRVGFRLRPCLAEGLDAPCKAVSSSSAFTKLAAKDPDHAPEGATGPMEEYLQEAARLWRILVVERSWLDPRSIEARRDVIVATGKAAELAALFAAGLSGIQKAQMIARVADGQPPIDDEVMIEQSGRLVHVVSGIIWPFLQFNLFAIAAIAVYIFLFEDQQRYMLSVYGVDVDAQRLRRMRAAALIMLCAFLVSTPPFPGTS